MRIEHTRRTKTQTVIEPREGDTRYVGRKQKRQFRTAESAGRALAMDRPHKAKNETPKGQRDRGVNIARSALGVHAYYRIGVYSVFLRRGHLPAASKDTALVKCFVYSHALHLQRFERSCWDVDNQRLTTHLRNPTRRTNPNIRWEKSQRPVGLQGTAVPARRGRPFSPVFCFPDSHDKMIIAGQSFGWLALGGPPL